MATITIPLYDLSGKSQGDVTLDAGVFGVTPKPALIHQAISATLANRRAATAHTKDRAVVAGSGKKPWRQKGTGNARAGSTRSPLWRGGGITFGPTNLRNYKQRLPQKMRQTALMMALSSKVSDKQLLALTSLQPLDGKTKTWVTSAAQLPSASKSILVIDNEMQDMAYRSIRNTKNHKYTTIDNLSLLDVIRFSTLLITKEALEALEAKLQHRTAKKKQDEAQIALTTPSIVASS